MESIKILTLGGITLDEALKTVKDIADRYERQMQLLETVARIDKIRRQNQERWRPETM